MTLLVAPVVIALALLAILTPRLFTVLWRLSVFLAVLCLLYVVDGQREHPVLPHADGKSAAVR